MTDVRGQGYAGNAGYCLKCDQHMKAGEPDACLGWIPGVVSACCGHGSQEAHVLWSGFPRHKDWEPASEDALMLDGDKATAFFDLIADVPRKWRHVPVGEYSSWEVIPESTYKPPANEGATP